MIRALLRRAAPVLLVLFALAVITAVSAEGAALWLMFGPGAG